MSRSSLNKRFIVINPRPEHFSQIQDLCKRVYPFSNPWLIAQLESHRSYFPDGQLIAIDKETNRVVGLAFSLIIVWNDYSPQDNWGDFTSGGYFHNHNPKKGKTLYGAEVMVDPEMRGKGIGKLLYQGRKEIVEKYQLKRIRAGARLRGYSKFKDKYSPSEYVNKVIKKEIFDPTLSFQLNQGFVVIDVAKNYLFNDPESLGYAAVIEWMNPKQASASDWRKQENSVRYFLENNKYVPEFLPRELRRLVRKVTSELGQIIKENEGPKFYSKIEKFRELLKKTRGKNNSAILEAMLKSLEKESARDRFAIAHSFSLQLELVNVCESAYRTWRQRHKPIPQSLAKKSELNYVLTAHPTEARPREVVSIHNKLINVLIESVQNNFSFNEQKISTLIRMLWIQPLAKQKSPTVMDEAEYVYSLIFSRSIFDFIVSNHPSFNLKLRTWVGGDKDGHPGVDRHAMKNSLDKSRSYLIELITQKIDLIRSDLDLLGEQSKFAKKESKKFLDLSNELRHCRSLKTDDGNQIKKWNMKFQSFIKTASDFLKKHHQVSLLLKTIDLFPALVMPLELREDAGKIKEALTNKSSIIRLMLVDLQKFAGALGISAYTRGLVISHCESADDIENAKLLIDSSTLSKSLPIIPLFESRAALQNAKKITKEWLKNKSNLERVSRFWSKKFEIMLGYSDSSKEIGVLPSRLLIRTAMFDLESVLQSYRLSPVFFHGSGGSVARGGGSLKEQIAWWPNSAIKYAKMTIQGEMIHRIFSTKEILNSQCIHLSNEALKRKVIRLNTKNSTELEKFSEFVEIEYKSLLSNKKTLSALLQSSPYQYLNLLKIGSRPSSRPSLDHSISNLRAIPWVLCWTQTRNLFPSWWGVGSAWEKMSPEEKKNLKEEYEKNAFFSSYIKSLGFTLAKVELDIWEMYVKSFEPDSQKELVKLFKNEYKKTSLFLHEITDNKQLIWFKPWLEESIKLRAPQIHILNLLQILAIKDHQESLLKETIVGISCGMLTTG